MSSTLTSGRCRTRRLATLAVGAAVATTVSLAGPAAGAGVTKQAEPQVTTSGSQQKPALSTDAADYTDGTYIVQLAGDPLASYTGTVSGYAATQPAPGTTIDTTSAAAKKYDDLLEKRQRDVVATVGAEVLDSHTVAFNGATVELTAQQAAKLAGSKDVVALTKDTLRHVTSDQSPAYLQMPQLWKAAGGKKNAGAGVVVGVLDTGIWPESESFTPNGTLVPASFDGECVTGERWNDEDCNGKIVGARYYVEGFGEENIAKREFLSPRDADGHGSHTASTAAGNVVDDVVVDGTEFGTVSGMAPGAKIAAYKVCWVGKPTVGDGCANSDLLAGVNDAVADGVDVINFSIGSTTESPVDDPVEIAFLNAAAAGVFVATSAGNSGPGESTLDHPSPWTTTVAATTHKINEKKLVLGDGREFVGASSTATLPEQTPMVLAEDAPAAGVEPEVAALCGTGSLDPAEVAGMLVVCERGVVDRIEKSLTVRNAGGAGMVMINPTANSINADLHFVPSIHLDVEAYEPVTTYVEAGGATGAIVELAPGDSDTRTPSVIDFSSRGPSTTTGGNILKPDISAPGVDVLAAVTPQNHEGRNYDLLSGTSMAAPHIAGIAAVMMGLNPAWSPMMIKSAMMLTARNTFGTNTPFEQGAGNVRPAEAVLAPVVTDSRFGDWVGYLKDEGLIDPGALPQYPAVSGTDLNQSSIAVGQLVDEVTTTRTFTNVTSKSQTLSFTGTAKGFEITTDVKRLRIAPGTSESVRITISRTDAPIERWTTGRLEISTNRGVTMDMPVALFPVAASVSETDIRVTGETGSTTVEVVPGYTGTMHATVHGLAATTPVADSVAIAQGAFDPEAPADTGEAVDTYDITVPEGATLARMSIDGAAASDLDIWLYQVDADGELTLVAIGATGSADEEITFEGIPAGEYRAFVHGFAGTDGAYVWRSWVVGTDDEGNLVVTPATTEVTSGDPVEFTLSWDGLAAAQDYLGWVRFADDADNGVSTIIEIR